MAHELGHLVLHQDRHAGDPALEPVANQFASAFLLPRTGFLREFPRQSTLNWDLLFALKRRWKASAAAIVRRAFDLGRVDAIQYRRAYKIIHARGWHRGEPDEPEEERPELISSALNLLWRRKNRSPDDIRMALCWKPATLMKILGESIPEPPADPPASGENVIPLTRARVR